MAPVIATLVLEGGRVGDELGGMALLELGSALAAVTSTDAGSDAGASTPATDDADETASHLEPTTLGRAPRWIDDTPPRASSGGTTSSSRHIATVVPGVRFPSLEALRAAVRRCALTRAALVPVATGSPEKVAAALGPSRAATCAAQVLAPGRKGVPRPALEAVGARLWDAGIGCAVAANRAWLERLAASSSVAATRGRDDVDETTPQRAGASNEPSVRPHYYVVPEGILGEIAAWGMDSRARLRAIDAPNAAPPEQATLAANAARVKPGDFVVDPCVGGGAIAFAAAELGAERVLGCDVDAHVLEAAREAARRFFRAGMAPREDGEDGSEDEDVWRRRARATSISFAEASLLEDPAVSAAYGPLENAVDAIVTDLPYGVRSAAVSASGSGRVETPAAMLRAMLALARRALKRDGRVAVWLRKAVADADGGVGGMSAAQVAEVCASFGFGVERCAGETRASGVQRALYVLTRDDGGETRAVSSLGRRAAETVAARAAAARRDREAAEAAAHEARAAALVMHCRLRRNENHGRVAASGGQDVWRAAWTGDVAATRRLLSPFSGAREGAREGEDASFVRSRDAARDGTHATARGVVRGDEPILRRVVNAREPAGARNTPLMCAAMYGRGAAVDALLALGAEVEARGGGGSTARRRTATHRAAERGAAEIVAVLLRRGGDPFVVRPATANGGTAFHAAAERGHSRVFSLLLDFCREEDERRARGSDALEAFEAPPETPETRFGSRAIAGRANARARVSLLASALVGEDDSGRTPALAAARRGHSDVVAAALAALEAPSAPRRVGADGSDGDSPSRADGASASPGDERCARASRATEEAAVAAAVEAARWGHVEAVRAAAAFVDFSGASRRGTDALRKLAFEAERWRRDDVRAFVAGLWAASRLPRISSSSSVVPETAQRRTRDGGARTETGDGPSVSFPAVPDGASAIRADARSGAALFYARDFFRDPSLVSSMLAAFEGAYLPRDHPLVTPADRRGERRAVPRDQAYYAAQYVSREDAARAATGAKFRKRAWFASYRYNPDRTQQPTPSSDPPAGLLALAAKVARATGQTCNHAVINRYADGNDSIGAHADKDLDLARGSFVVSVSFGAERVMTFQPRRNLEDAEARTETETIETTNATTSDDVSFSSSRRASPETVKSTRRALRSLLSADPEWRAASEAKARAPPRSDAKRAAAALEKARAAALRAGDPAVTAAAADADTARRAWREYRDAKAFHVTLEHGSAVFFNMAFNERWTHAVDAAGSPGLGLSEDDEDAGKDESANTERMREGCAGDDARCVGERVGVTLRRCRTVFDPELCAAPDLPRARRRDAWRGLRESMADVDAAETGWREG